MICQDGKLLKIRAHPSYWQGYFLPGQEAYFQMVLSGAQSDKKHVLLPHWKSIHMMFSNFTWKKSTLRMLLSKHGIKAGKRKGVDTIFCLSRQHEADSKH